jgi:hypothetical protein
MGGAPLAYSCRYVAKSDAFLAMNRFDQTCVISLDGIWNKATRKFLDAVPDAMEAAGIPYTQHWGKTNGYTPKRLKRIYGDDYDAWIRARHELLASENERALFNSEFMKTTGLDR